MGPKAAVKTKGKMTGTKNYDKRIFAQVVEDVLPKNSLGWDRVAESYGNKTGDDSKTGDNCKRYFWTTMCAGGRKPTGKPGSQKDLTLRCQRIWNQILEANEMAVYGLDEDDDDEDGGDDDEPFELEDNAEEEEDGEEDEDEDEEEEPRAKKLKTSSSSTSSAPRKAIAASAPVAAPSAPLPILWFTRRRQRMPSTTLLLAERQRMR